MRNIIISVFIGVGLGSLAGFLYKIGAYFAQRYLGPDQIIDASGLMVGLLITIYTVGRMYEYFERDDEEEERG